MSGRLLSLFAFLVLLLVAHPARAERELIVPFEESGHVVLDQLAGLRLSSIDGTSYGGVAGIATRTTKLASGAEAKTTSLWLAPSFDWFVIDHFSVGGLVEVRHSWGAPDLRPQTSMTFLPRVGFYVPFSDRIGLWPRASFGYTESASAHGGAMVLDLDVSCVYRFNETFFMRAGPEIGALFGDQSSWQVSGVIGFGMNVEL